MALGPAVTDSQILPMLVGQDTLTGFIQGSPGLQTGTVANVRDFQEKSENNFALYADYSTNSQRDGLQHTCSFLVPVVLAT